MQRKRPSTRTTTMLLLEETNILVLKVLGVLFEDIRDQNMTE
jgi:hypothetical protein